MRWRTLPRIPAPGLSSAAAPPLKMRWGDGSERRVFGFKQTLGGLPISLNGQAQRLKAGASWHLHRGRLVPPYRLARLDGEFHPRRRRLGVVIGTGGYRFGHPVRLPTNQKRLGDASRFRTGVRYKIRVEVVRWRKLN